MTFFYQVFQPKAQGLIGLLTGLMALQMALLDRQTVLGSTLDYQQILEREP